MKRYQGAVQTEADELIKKISRVSGDQLKALLEGKHIYQQVVIDAPVMIAAWVARMRAGSARIQIDEKEFEKERFKISTQQFFAGVTGNVPDCAVLTLILGNVKLYCLACDEREVFSPVWFLEMGNELGQFWQAENTKEVVQLFAISFQCQRCKGKLQGVIVRREGWRLRLDGRSPMEIIQVPKYIPKEESHLFRDALVALHGGKPLAALFYLRIFIEMFARRVTGETERMHGDQLMEAYGETLPENKRDMMPSLREWYGKLSEPIHAAKPDADLFEKARAAIEEHFDIRRVFKISEAPAKSAAPTSGSPTTPK
jgi:hypothetical protein